MKTLLAIRNRRGICALAIVLAICVFPGQVLAVQGLILSVGHDIDSGTESIRLNFNRSWFTQQVTQQHWFLDAYWEIEVAYWDGDTGVTGSASLVDTGLTPVLRLQRDPLPWKEMRPYIEGGVGVHLLSKTDIEDKQLSTNVQFGSHIGLGVTFGGHRPFELGYRFQHLSNASIKQPNPGINFHLVRLGYYF